MRVIGLVSGGKDSCYAMMQCVAAGHEVVALATLMPPDGQEETDSFMYQSVGVRQVVQIAAAMDLPLLRAVNDGQSVNTTADYSKPVPGDEVEALYRLLKEAKERSELNIEGVSVGAILSDYQRVRVENVCRRLGLVCYSFLWRRDQSALLAEMLGCRLEAVIVKVAGAGLEPRTHCGKSLAQMWAKLHLLNSKFGVHVCGEGGEFETFTLDCPLFRRRINIVEQKLIEEPGDVGYLILEKLELLDKDVNQTRQERLDDARVPAPLYYVKELLTSAAAVLSFPDTSSPPTTAPISVSPSQHYSTMRGVQHLDANKRAGWWGSYGYRGDDLQEIMAHIAASLPPDGLPASCCEVRALVRSLADYAAFNAAYVDHFRHSPPVRACVQPLAAAMSTAYDISLVGYTGPPQHRRTMHVQSVSHWAPANIGPYSQAVKVGGLVLLAGMIGLVPGSMTLVEGGAVPQTALCVRHIGRVLAAIVGDAAASSVDAALGEDAPRLLQLTCYSVSRTDSQLAGPILAQLRCPKLFVQVDKLPKNANVELHATGHASACRVRTTRSSLGDGSNKSLLCHTCRTNDGSVVAVAAYGDVTDKETPDVSVDIFTHVGLQVLTEMTIDRDVTGTPATDLDVTGTPATDHDVTGTPATNHDVTSTPGSPMFVTVLYNAQHVSISVAEECVDALRRKCTAREDSGTAVYCACIGSPVPVTAVGNTAAMTSKFAITAAVYADPELSDARSPE